MPQAIIYAVVEAAAYALGASSLVATVIATIAPAKLGEHARHKHSRGVAR